MAIIKSINENYKGWDSSLFLTKERLQEVQQIIKDQKRDVLEWIPISPELYIATMLNDIQEETADKLYSLWSDLRKDGSGGKKKIKNKVNRYILIVKGDEWQELQFKVYNRLKENKSFHTWLGLYDIQSNEIIDPLQDTEISFIQRIQGIDDSKAKNTIHRLSAFKPFLNYILNNTIEEKTNDVMLEQAKTKPEKLDNWKNRLVQAKMWDEDEEILDIAHVRVKRNHYTVNSNFNRSGKLIVTNKKTIFAKRSFSLFGFGLAALIPLIVFARPANKLIALGRMAVQYLKVPFKALRPIISSVLPAIAVTIVSVNFIDFSPITNWVNNLLDQIPSLNLFVPALNFFIENPWTLVSFGGFYAMFRVGILKLFFRREKLIVLPHDQLNYLTANNQEIVGRWRVKGSQILNAKEGIEYRFSIRSFDKDRSSQQLAQHVQLLLLTHGSEQFDN